MKVQLILVAAAVTLLTTGCWKDHKTVEWYDQHPEEREATLKWCAEDATRAADADCMNATKSHQVQNLTNGKRTFGNNYQFK